MGFKKNVLICLPHFQNNHISYYWNLLEEYFETDEVSVLAYTFHEDSKEKLGKFNSYFPNKKETTAWFLLKNIRLFRKADIIIYEELYKVSLSSVFLVALFGKKTFLTVHNVHKWLKREKPRSLKERITSGIINFIIFKIRGIITVSLSLKNYILQEKLFHKDVYYVPFTKVSVQKREKITKGATLNFTIPGTINNDRRDYKLVLEALWELLSKDTYPITLYLLGKVVKLSNEEKALIQKINTQKPNTIIYWETFISESVFDEILQKTHYLIGNIKLQYTENRIPEIYGKSKETGVLFLMLAHQIPTLFPEGFQTDAIYKDLILYYPDNKSGFAKKIQSVCQKENTTVLNFNFEQHKAIVEHEKQHLRNNL